MDTKPQKQTQSTGSYKTLWTEKQEETLMKALTFCYRNATEKFGAELDLEMRVEGFKFTLEDDYSMEQVLSCIKTHMKKSNQMIGTADIEAILNPPSPKITTAEYVNAKKWQELNGYSAYTPEAILIRDYEAQQAEDREPKQEGAPCPALMARAKHAIENKGE